MKGRWGVSSLFLFRRGCSDSGHVLEVLLTNVKLSNRMFNLAVEILVALYDFDRSGEFHNPFFFSSFLLTNQLSTSS